MTSRRPDTAPQAGQHGAPARGRDAAPDAGTQPSRRIGGLDAARAVAVIGMVMVHFGPTGDDAPGVAGALYTAPHGRASILFVLLAGVGVSLLERSSERRSVWARLGLRAAVFAPLGLALQLLDHGVLVILQYYALYFLVAGAVARLADRVLLVLAAGAALLGPVMYLGAWQARPAWFETPALELTDPPVVIVRELLLSGSYPAITWAAPLVFGVWLGRRRLRDASVLLRMVVGGAAVALAAGLLSRALVVWAGVPTAEPSWWQLVVDEAHSQMPLWLIGSTASAIAVLATCVWVVDRLPRLTRPLVATGQLALTVYVAHLLLLAAWPELLQRDEVRAAAWSVLRFALVTVAAATAWRAVLSRGPLEAAVRLPLRPRR